MINMANVFRLMLWLTVLGLTGIPAQAQDFYRGKTVTIVVSTSTGGGYDAMARTIARHSAATYRAIPISSSATCRAPAALRQ